MSEIIHYFINYLVGFLLTSSVYNVRSLPYGGRLDLSEINDSSVNFISWRKTKEYVSVISVIFVVLFVSIYRAASISLLHY